MESDVADALPDPNGEPEGEKGDGFGTVIWLGFAALVAAGFLAPALFSRSYARGASRSGRIKWEQRQAEIDQAISTQNNKPNQVGVPQR